MTLIDLRTNKGFTIKEMAEYLGVSQSTYVNWELHPEDISIDIAKQIATFLKTDINDIFFDSNCN